MPFDILIKQAKLRNQTKLFNVGIKGGKITKIEENIKENSEITLDAKANLVTESFVNPHLHLCKVYTREMMDDEKLTGYHAADMGVPSRLNVSFTPKTGESVSVSGEVRHIE